MLKIIEDKNFLSNKNKDFIKHVFGGFFPFYYHATTGSFIKDDPYLAHIIIKRPEIRKKTEPFINSPYYEDVVDILNNFCKKNKIEYTKIIRAGFNLTYANGKKNCGWHTDHDFAHWQLIVYLNDCDKKSYTVLKNKNKIINIKPEKYKGVCFNRVKHKMIFPKQKERVVLVITFK